MDRKFLGSCLSFSLQGLETRLFSTHTLTYNSSLAQIQTWHKELNFQLKKYSDISKQRYISKLQLVAL